MEETRNAGAVIYLDYNATAPLRPEVFAAMKPFLTERWGNPSCSYSLGSQLKAEIEAARRAVAKLVNAGASEVVFTGSACLADSDEPSHVVRAMKPESAASRQMVRFSLGRETTGAEIESAVDAVTTVIARLR